MSNRKYFVYALTCGGEIRYIGITSQTRSFDFLTPTGHAIFAGSYGR